MFRNQRQLKALIISIAKSWQKGEMIWERIDHWGAVRGDGCIPVAIVFPQRFSYCIRIVSLKVQETPIYNGPWTDFCFSLIWGTVFIRWNKGGCGCVIIAFVNCNPLWISCWTLCPFMVSGDICGLKWVCLEHSLLLSSLEKGLLRTKHPDLFELKKKIK